jgi:hypothetical protein
MVVRSRGNVDGFGRRRKRSQDTERCSVESDTFEDLQLHDFVEANKRWADVG